FIVRGQRPSIIQSGIELVEEKLRTLDRMRWKDQHLINEYRNKFRVKYRTIPGKAKEEARGLLDAVAKEVEGLIEREKKTGEEHRMTAADAVTVLDLYKLKNELTRGERMVIPEEVYRYLTGPERAEINAYRKSIIDRFDARFREREALVAKKQIEFLGTMTCPETIIYLKACHSEKRARISAAMNGNDYPAFVKAVKGSMRPIEFFNLHTVSGHDFRKEYLDFVRTDLAPLFFLAEEIFKKNAVYRKLKNAAADRGTVFELTAGDFVSSIEGSEPYFYADFAGIKGRIYMRETSYSRLEAERLNSYTIKAVLKWCAWEGPVAMDPEFSIKEMVSLAHGPLGDGLAREFRRVEQPGLTAGTKVQNTAKVTPRKPEKPSAPERPISRAQRQANEWKEKLRRRDWSTQPGRDVNGESRPNTPSDIALVANGGKWVQYELTAMQHEILNKVLASFRLKDNRVKSGIILHDFRKRLHEYGLTSLPVFVYAPNDDAFYTKLYEEAASSGVLFPARDVFRIFVHAGTYRDGRGNARSYNLFMSQGTLKIVSRLYKEDGSAYEEYLKHEIAHIVNKADKRVGAKKKEPTITKENPIDGLIKTVNLIAPPAANKSTSRKVSRVVTLKAVDEGIVVKEPSGEYTIPGIAAKEYIDTIEKSCGKGKAIDLPAINDQVRSSVEKYFALCALNAADGNVSLALRTLGISLSSFLRCGIGEKEISEAKTRGRKLARPTGVSFGTLSFWDRVNAIVFELDAMMILKAREMCAQDPAHTPALVGLSAREYINLKSYVQIFSAKSRLIRRGRLNGLLRELPAYTKTVINALEKYHGHQTNAAELELKITHQLINWRISAIRRMAKRIGDKKTLRDLDRALGDIAQYEVYCEELITAFNAKPAELISAVQQKMAQKWGIPAGTVSERMKHIVTYEKLMDIEDPAGRLKRAMIRYPDSFETTLSALERANGVFARAAEILKIASPNVQKKLNILERLARLKQDKKTIERISLIRKLGKRSIPETRRQAGRSNMAIWLLGKASERFINSLLKTCLLKEGQRREEQDIVIGIDLDWINKLKIASGIDVGSSETINEVINRIETNLKKTNIKNLHIVKAKGSSLQKAVLERMGEIGKAKNTDISLSNAVILADKETAATGKLSRLTSDGVKPGAFVAVVDLSKFEAKNTKLAVDETLYNCFFEMLETALRMSFEPDKPVQTRFVRTEKYDISDPEYARF
ncbi:MAG: hypothetical protein HQL28_00680, partial [Candidatus Omnitrophica bacterium]|nr:hypothetical protein [Candidatus Omnitrophota bacterium]